MKHEECASSIRKAFTERGGDVTVSTAAPLIETPYSGTAYDCPHGVTFWIEPTSEQIAVWARKA